MRSLFALLSDSLKLFRAHAALYLGYSAWLLLPYAANIFLVFLPENVFSVSLAAMLNITIMFLSLFLFILFVHLTHQFLAKEPMDEKKLRQQSVPLMLPVLV